MTILLYEELLLKVDQHAAKISTAADRKTRRSGHMLLLRDGVFPLAGGASSQGGEVAAEPGLEPLGLEYGALAEALLRSPAQDGAAEVGVLKRLGRG